MVLELGRDMVVFNIFEKFGEYWENGVQVRARSANYQVISVNPDFRILNIRRKPGEDWSKDVEVKARTRNLSSNICKSRAITLE